MSTRRVAQAEGLAREFEALQALRRGIGDPQPEDLLALPRHFRREVLMADEDDEGSLEKGLRALIALVDAGPPSEVELLRLCFNFDREHGEKFWTARVEAHALECGLNEKTVRSKADVALLRLLKRCASAGTRRPEGRLAGNTQIRRPSFKEGTVVDTRELLAARQRKGTPPPILVFVPASDGTNERRSEHRETNPRLDGKFTAAGGSIEDYLAVLASDGWVGTVLTTSVDSALDQAFARFLGPDAWLRLVLGEHSETHLLRSLGSTYPSVKVVKVMGDVVGRSVQTEVSLPHEVAAVLAKQANALEVLWFGPFDNSLYHQILAGFTGTITVAARHTGEHLRRLVFELAGLTANETRTVLRRQVTDQLRRGQGLDATYSDRLVRRLAQDILDKCDGWDEPTLLVYVHDPQAPGGSEVRKRIGRYLTSIEDRVPDELQIEVRGSQIRWLERQAGILGIDSLTARQYRRIVIVDSISFTGRTLELATRAVRQLAPAAEMYWAVLAASSQLLRNLSHLSIDADHFLRAFESDRHDIFFPWGWTQATSAFERSVPVHDKNHDVVITQRPWGTIEVLSNQMECSVRILTIRAGHRLSLQRHLLRDEFFIALDDYVGVEFESDDGLVIDAGLLSKGDYLSIPRGAVHRFAAHRDSVRLLEISFGLYDQVHDIQRLEDDYGRLDELGDV